MKKPKKNSFDQISLFEAIPDLPPSPPVEEKPESSKPVEGAVNLFDCGLEKRRRTWKRHVELSDKALNTFLSKVRKGLKEQLRDCGDTLSINVDYDFQTLDVGNIEFTIIANRHTGRAMEITMSQTVKGPEPEAGTWLFNKKQHLVEVVPGESSGEWLRFVSIPWTVELNNKNAYQTAFQINKLYHKAQMLWA